MPRAEPSSHSSPFFSFFFLFLSAPLSLYNPTPQALPSSAKVAKDGKDTIQECVSEFVSFITSEASDKCQREKRKTINGDDILWAMSTLGFDKYIEPLKVYLSKYVSGVRQRPVRVLTVFCPVFFFWVLHLVSALPVCVMFVVQVVLARGSGD